MQSATLMIGISKSCCVWHQHNIIIYSPAGETKIYRVKRDDMLESTSRGSQRNTTTQCWLSVGPSSATLPNIEPTLDRCVVFTWLVLNEINVSTLVSTLTGTLPSTIHVITHSVKLNSTDLHYCHRVS